MFYVEVHARSLTLAQLAWGPFVRRQRVFLWPQRWMYRSDSDECMYFMCCKFRLFSHRTKTNLTALTAQHCCECGYGDLELDEASSAYTPGGGCWCWENLIDIIAGERGIPRRRTTKSWRNHHTSRCDPRASSHQHCWLQRYVCALHFGYDEIALTLNWRSRNYVVRWCRTLTPFLINFSYIINLQQLNNQTMHCKRKWTKRMWCAWCIQWRMIIHWIEFQRIGCHWYVNLRVIWPNNANPLSLWATKPISLIIQR